MATIAATESPLTGSAWSNKLRTSAWSDVVRGGGGGCPVGHPSSSSPEKPTQVKQSPPSPAPELKFPSSSDISIAPVEPASPSGPSASKPLSTLPVPAKQQTSSCDTVDASEKNGDDNVGTTVKKPAWGKPSDSSYMAPVPVMGASSWPDLVECTRPVTKSAVSSKTDENKTAAQEAPISKPGRDNTIVKFNHATSHNQGRQRQVKRGGGVNRHNGGQSRPPNPLPSNPSYQEMSQNNAATPPGGVVPFVPHAPPPRDTGATAGFSPSHVHPVNGHHVPRRRNNFGQYAPRDGARNDHVRGPNGWNNGPVWVNRGFHGQSRGGGRGFSPTGPVFPLYANPPPMRPHGNAFGYPDSAAMMYYVPTPVPNHLVPMPISSVGPTPPHGPVMLSAPMPDPMAVSVSGQIDYYFSDENLVKDVYLRSNMDAEGWVPISLIASFRRIQSKNVSIPFILEALKLSKFVEVKDDRVRRRDKWMQWVPTIKLPNSSSGNSSAGTAQDELVSSTKKDSLDEATKELADRSDNNEGRA